MGLGGNANGPKEVMSAAGTHYRILVGTDYSAASEQAVEGAFAIAAATANSDVHVVHVTAFGSDTVATNTNANDSALEQHLAQLDAYVALSLESFEKRRAGSGCAPMRVAAHLRGREPAREIAQLAADLQADLVVVGMHPRGVLSRYFLGSVAGTVARLAPCPVLVFRPKLLAREYEMFALAYPLCLNVLSAQHSH